MVEMQDWSLDWFLQSSHAPCSTDVYIVSITDRDYRDPALFKGQSPLKPEKIVRLLDAVLRLAPKVVGVDLDTKDTDWIEAVNGVTCRVENGVLRVSAGSDSAEATKPNAHPNGDSGLLCLIPKGDPAVIWAQIPVEAAGEDGQDSAKPIQTYQVLGKCRRDCDFSTGIPSFLKDADGVTRRYVGEFKLSGEEQRPVASFAKMIANRYRSYNRENSEKLIINFSHRKNFRTIDAGDLLRITDPRQDPTAGKTKSDQSSNREKENRDWMGAVSGKIVLIGGEFEDANDTHDTPGRGFFPKPISGVRLNAQAIDAELYGEFIKPVPGPIPFLSDLVLGTLFVFIFWFALDYLEECSWFVSRHWDKYRVLIFFGATVFTIAIAIFTSWLVFKLSFWMSFIPILVGANIHQYIAHAEKLSEKKPSRPASKRVRGLT